MQRRRRPAQRKFKCVRPATLSLYVCRTRFRPHLYYYLTHSGDIKHHFLSVPRLSFGQRRQASRKSPSQCHIQYASFCYLTPNEESVCTHINLFYSNKLTVLDSTRHYRIRSSMSVFYILCTIIILKSYAWYINLFFNKKAFVKITICFKNFINLLLKLNIDQYWYLNSYILSPSCPKSWSGA